MIRYTIGEKSRRLYNAFMFFRDIMVVILGHKKPSL